MSGTEVVSGVVGMYHMERLGSNQISTSYVFIVDFSKMQPYPPAFTPMFYSQLWSQNFHSLLANFLHFAAETFSFLSSTFDTAPFPI